MPRIHHLIDDSQSGNLKGEGEMSNGIVLFLLVFFIAAVFFGKSKKSGKSRKEVRGKRDAVCSSSGKVEVKSSSDPSTTYLLTPEDIRCTCPDWEKKRASRDFSGKPERVCKHLAQYYAAHPANVPQSLKPWLPFIERMAAKGWGLPTTNVLYIDDESLDGVVIDCYPYLTRGWVDVYIQDAKFGYNPKGQRWAGNDEPINSPEWIHIINQMTACFESYSNTPKVPHTRHIPIVEEEQHVSQEDEKLYAEVYAFLQEQERISISLVQRRFRIGFNKASRFVERIEKEQREAKYHEIVLSYDMSSEITIKNIVKNFNVSYEEAEYFINRMQNEGNIPFTNDELIKMEEDKKHEEAKITIGKYEEYIDFYKQAESFSLGIGCISAPELKKHFGLYTKDSFVVATNLLFLDTCKHLPFSFRLPAKELKKKWKIA